MIIGRWKKPDAPALGKPFPWQNFSRNGHHEIHQKHEKWSQGG